jgi:hypothetical protein
VCAGIGLAQTFARLRSDFLQASGQKFFAHCGEVAFPPQLHSESDRRIQVGAAHQLDVLHVLFGSAVDHARNQLGHVGVRSGLELIEAGEEVIVSGFVSRTPVAHRPGVNDLVVENVVRVGAANRGARLVLFAGVARRAEQLRGRSINTEIIRSREVDQVLGINGATKMVVEVSALGHVVHKREQQRRLTPDRVEIARSLLLGSLGRRQGSKYQDDHAAASRKAHSERASGNQAL